MYIYFARQMTAFAEQVLHLLLRQNYCEVYNNSVACVEHIHHRVYCQNALFIVLSIQTEVVFKHFNRYPWQTKTKWYKIISGHSKSLINFEMKKARYENL